MKKAGGKWWKWGQLWCSGFLVTWGMFTCGLITARTGVVPWTVSSIEVTLYSTRILSILRLLKYHEHELNNALIGQDPDAGKDYGPEAKGQQRLRWLHGVTDSVDMIEEAWRIAACRVAGSRAQLGDWTIPKYTYNEKHISFPLSLWFHSQVTAMYHFRGILPRLLHFWCQMC